MRNIETSERVAEVLQPRLWPGMKGLAITRVVPERQSMLDPKQAEAMREVSNAMLHEIVMGELGITGETAHEIVLLDISKPEPQA